MLKLLEESTHDVNVGNEEGETPLLLACRAGNYYVAIQLLESGADPNIANSSGDTPLHWLLSFEQDQIAGIGKPLIELTHGIDRVSGLWQATFPGENAFIKGTPLMRAIALSRDLGSPSLKTSKPLSCSGPQGHVFFAYSNVKRRLPGSTCDSVRKG